MMNSQCQRTCLFLYGNPGRVEEYAVVLWVRPALGADENCVERTETHGDGRPPQGARHAAGRTRRPATAVQPIPAPAGPSPVSRQEDRQGEMQESGTAEAARPPAKLTAQMMRLHSLPHRKPDAPTAMACGWERQILALAQRMSS